MGVDTLALSYLKSIRSTWSRSTIQLYEINPWWKSRGPQECWIIMPALADATRKSILTSSDS